MAKLWRLYSSNSPGASEDPTCKHRCDRLESVQISNPSNKRGALQKQWPHTKHNVTMLKIARNLKFPQISHLQFRSSTPSSHLVIHFLGLPTRQMNGAKCAGVHFRNILQISVILRLNCYELTTSTIDCWSGASHVETCRNSQEI